MSAADNALAALQECLTKANQECAAMVAARDSCADECKKMDVRIKGIQAAIDFVMKKSK